MSDYSSTIVSELAELTLESVSQVAVEHAEINQHWIDHDRTIADLAKSDLAGKNAAIVIAAGPSLHRHDTARMIKDSGFTGVIIATESSMSWCLRNDIVPHLTVTLDPHPKRIVRWFGDPELSVSDMAEDDYFARQDFDPAFQSDDLAFNRELIELVNRHGPKMKIAIASCASSAVVERAIQAGMDRYWWNPIYDDFDIDGGLTRRLHERNKLPCLNAGGNVGSACWVFAHAVLGVKHVALLGMDLSYYGETSYRETQKYYELIDLVGEENLSEIFTHIHNPYVDREFFTDPTFLWYRDAFLQMAQWASESGVVTYNCTGGGVLFGDAIEFVPFEDFLAAIG